MKNNYDINYTSLQESLILYSSDPLDFSIFIESNDIINQENDYTKDSRISMYFASFLVSLSILIKPELACAKESSFGSSFAREISEAEQRRLFPHLKHTQNLENTKNRFKLVLKKEAKNIIQGKEKDLEKVKEDLIKEFYILKRGYDFLENRLDRETKMRKMKFHVFINERTKENQKFLDEWIKHSQEEKKRIKLAVNKLLQRTIVEAHIADRATLNSVRKVNLLLERLNLLLLKNSSCFTASERKIRADATLKQIFCLLEELNEAFKNSPIN